MSPCPHCGHPDPHEPSSPLHEASAPLGNGQPKTERSEQADPGLDGAPTEDGSTSSSAPDTTAPPTIQGSVFARFWRSFAHNWIAIFSSALTTVLLATALYLWLMDTRMGLTALGRHEFAIARLWKAGPFILLAAVLLSNRVIRWVDFIAIAGALLVVTFLPDWMQVIVLLVPAVTARVGNRPGWFGRWSHSLGAAAGATLLTALALTVIRGVECGDPTAADFFVSWPLLLQDGLATGTFALGLGLVCQQQTAHVLSAGRQFVAGGMWLAVGVLSLGFFHMLSVPPCQDYADRLVTTCATGCGFGREMFEQTCTDEMASGLLTREAARTAVGACGEWRESCERIRMEERRAEVERKIRYGDRSLCRGMTHAQEVCEALFGVAEPGIDKEAGRSTSAQRRTVKRYLKDRGYKKIWGFIVARTSPGVYEAAWTRRTRWGSVPTGSRFVLETTMTEYSTKGTFSMWARKTGTRRVSLVSGFTDDWDVYEEDPFGSVIQAIWDAPAGHETSEAAREALLGLCILEGLYE